MIHQYVAGTLTPELFAKEMQLYKKWSLFRHVPVLGAEVELYPNDTVVRATTRPFGRGACFFVHCEFLVTVHRLLSTRTRSRCR